MPHSGFSDSAWGWTHGATASLSLGDQRVIPEMISGHQEKAWPSPSHLPSCLTLSQADAGWLGLEQV